VAAINVGSVGVSVVPDAQRFAPLLRQQLNPQAKAVGESVGKQISDEVARKVRDGVATGLREGSGRAAGRKTGEEFGSEFARAAKALIEGRAPSVHVDADTAGAFTKLERVSLQADRLGRSRPTVTADADTGGATAKLAALQAQSVAAGSGMSALVAAGLLLGPAIVPAAAAATVAVAGIGAAAVAAGAGVGVLILGFSGVFDAVKALGEAEKAAGKDAATLATRQLQIASAADQVRSAEAGLTNARANAADAATRAADQVRSAEQTLAQAQVQARNAQLDLTRAREDARRAMQDLEMQVRGGALAQRQANLDVQRAKIELDKVLADPRANELQRQQAQLSYEQAVQQLDDQRLRNQRLGQEKAASDRAGVEGSRQVTGAQQQLVSAQRQVGKAQQDVADARRAQDVQARQSAFTVAQAQQAVVSAQRSLQAATVTAGVAGSAAMVKLRDSMAALSPEGQRFARFLFSLKPRLDALRATAQAGLLPGVEAGIRALLPYFPQLNRFVASAARVLGDMFAAAGRALTSPFWREFFGFLAENALPTLRQIGRIVGNLAAGFAGLFMAFNPAAKDFGNGLEGLTARFAAWSKGLRDNRGFQEFLGYVRENGPRVVAMLGSVFRGVGQVAVALAPIGALVLGGLKVLGDVLAVIPPEVLTVLAVGIVATTVAVWGLNTALLVMAANPVVLWTAGIVVALTALAAAVVWAWNRFPGFQRAVKAAWDGIVTASKWAWENVLRPTFAAIGTFVTDTLAPVVLWLWRNVFQPAFEGIAAAVSWAWDNVVHPVFNFIVALVRNVLGPVFFWLWRNVVSPVWTGIRIAISVAWAAVRVVFGLVQIALRILAGIFMWLWRTVIRPAWDGIASLISAAWRNVIRPIFNALGGFITTYVAPAFRRGVDAIGRAWEAVRNIARAPVKFVIETVLNQGILRAYNELAKLFHVKPDNVQVPLPKGFAAGGIYPGYTPGRDVGVIGVSGGEAVMRPEWTRAVGPEYVEAANRAARTGGVAAVQRWMGGYADGGVIGTITKPLDALRRFGNSAFIKLLTSIPKKIVDTIVDKVKGFVGLGPSGPGPAASGTVAAGLGAVSYPAIIALARQSGVPFTVSSTQRNSNDYHGRGLAVDMYDSVANMVRLARHFYRMSAYELELIHSGGGGFFVKNGKRVGAGFYGSEVANHYNHVHVAMTNPAVAAARKAFAYDTGGYLPPGLSTVYNGTGRPEPVLTDRQWRAQQQLAERGGGGTFTGTLVMEDGTFMGKVRGEMRAEVDSFAGTMEAAALYGGGS
jgi:hypothetical protein